MSVADGGHNAIALYQPLLKTHAAPQEYRVTPHLPFPIEALEPAWDPDF